MLAESKYDRIKARFEAITAESSDLLIENMELGQGKGDAARRKAIMLRIDEINTEANASRAIQIYLSRAACSLGECSNNSSSSLNTSNSSNNSSGSSAPTRR
jgi:hypothetical protein